MKMVGTYEDTDGVFYGIVGTVESVPEPSMLALLAFGSLAVLSALTLWHGEAANVAAARRGD